MKCSSNKCTETLDIDLSQLAEETVTVHCHQCKARSLVIRESFAGRSLRRAGEINCAKCGAELGHSLHCSGCGILYPDYFVAENPNYARRKRSKKRFKGFNFEFSLGPSAKPDKPQGFSPERSAHPKGAAAKSKTKLLTITLTLVVFLVLAALGASQYKQHKVEQQYSNEYFKALYGITAGAELSLSISNRLTTESKANAGVLPRVTAAEQTKLEKIKTATDAFMQQLKQPSPKFKVAHENIAKLYEQYGRLHILALSPSGSTTEYANQTAKFEADFRTTAKELKSNLPAKLAEDLPEAAKKFKTLQNL